MHTNSSKMTGKNWVLIHYVGDENVACNYPHGNSRSENVFHRTCKSVLNQLPSFHESPEIVYKNLVCKSDCPTQYQPYLLPRNSKQIANVQYKERQKNRLSHDALYNLHEIVESGFWYLFCTEYSSKGIASYTIHPRLSEHPGPCIS